MKTLRDENMNHEYLTAFGKTLVDMEAHNHVSLQHLALPFYDQG